MDIITGYNSKYNVKIDEHWVPWGRCYTIKSYKTSSNKAKIFIKPIHNGGQDIGIEIFTTV